MRDAFKACAVVFRETPRGTEILVFRHPLAGWQLVKGTVEPGESVEAAATRELFEEAGVTADAECVMLGSAEISDQVWHFVKLTAEALPDAWRFWCADGGGHEFDFSWRPLDAECPASEWHPIFQSAMARIRELMEIKRATA